MPDNDSPDTEIAPTEHASAETTELPPAKHTTEQAEAWSLADTAEVDSESPRRGWLISVGLVTLVLVIAGALIFLAATFFGFGHSKHDQPSAKPSTGAAPQPPPPPTSSQTASAAPAALPEVPPLYAGCLGTLVAHHDIQHKTLGAVRLFLVRSSGVAQGCIAAVANSGQALPPINVDVGALENFAFANPATDATGNTFVLYNPGRYDGVLVLIPNAGGFEDIGWDHAPGDPSFNLRQSGKHAYYYAQLLGPGTDGKFTIRQKHNDCMPNCADGTVTTQDLHWNGSDYVP
jgi:hypothetical protein